MDSTLHLTLLVIYYLFAGAAIAFAIWFYRLLNQPRFRGDQFGDVSTEAGYEEDEFGNVIPYATDDFNSAKNVPHFHATGSSHSGPM